MNEHITTRPRRLGGALETIRRFVANALFLGILVALVVLSVKAYRARPRVPDGAALVLKPEGVLVEQLSGTPRSRASARLAGVPAGPSQVLLRDVLDALRLATDDERIAALYLDVDGLTGGMSKLRAVRDALLDFESSGKRVVAYSEILTQRPYYLAAHATETILHPDGVLFLQGFGGYRPYYKEGLDRYGIDVHVFRVGEYKSAVEPFLRNDMSADAREAALGVYDDLWRTWLSDVAEARDLQPEEIQQWIEASLERLQDTGGDIPQAALDAGLVDTLGPRDAARGRMIELVGKDEDGKTFKQVAWRTYLAARADDRGTKGSGDGVAVVVAVGDVLDGSQPPGRIGGDSTARLIRRARQDDRARAIVLRIDSPGGSVFASSLIRRECELVREEGKPLVVSMSSVAASAAYFIASAADEIWAHPSTITGSIGIFALFPSVHEALERYLGVHFDGVGTTSYTGALNPGRPLDPRMAEIFQLAIDRGYERFVTRVAEARGQSWEEVDRVARGRVWSGEDALELGLVDKLGGLEEAIESAATRAELEEGYSVFYVEPERSLRDRLLDRLLAVAAVAEDAPELTAVPPAVHTIRSIEHELERLAVWNDPRSVYGHCLCGEEWP
ncbi:MAG: signal peptide peptidase SppA [Acidobacteria bacterium]|jgi:protease-4|nr:signal peptide peptidase SppA [Acidobacteriota bacterium]